MSEKLAYYHHEYIDAERTIRLALTEFYKGQPYAALSILQQYTASIDKQKDIDNLIEHVNTTYNLEKINE